MPPKKNLRLIFFLAILPFVLIFSSFASVLNQDYPDIAAKLNNWLIANRNLPSGLPKSHVGDKRFDGWSITYDSAVTTLAYIASNKENDARKIIDFYINTPEAWRLGGVIEAVNPGAPVLGEDWSVRSGSNIWLAIAGFHLYKATGDKKYLAFSKKLGDFILSLQDKDKKSLNYGGIRLGPLGAQHVSGDQHLEYDSNKPSFYEIFATEHNIDGYALFSMLFNETGEGRYGKGKALVLDWLRRVAYNKKEHRLNRGALEGKGIDDVVAADVHSWAISALGVDLLNTFEDNFAEKIADFVEKKCISEVRFKKPDGKAVLVKGVDFVDKERAHSLKREPLVSPEWTFQLINSYRILEEYFKGDKNIKKAIEYRKKREGLTKSILKMAVEYGDTLSFPYASEPDVPIGHEYKTPNEGNLSTIGTAYAILSLTGYEPLVYRRHTKDE